MQNGKWLGQHAHHGAQHDDNDVQHVDQHENTDAQHDAQQENTDAQHLNQHVGPQEDVDQHEDNVDQREVEIVCVLTAKDC